MKEFLGLEPFIIVKSILDLYLHKNINCKSICKYKYTIYEYRYKYLLDFFIENKEQLMFSEYLVNRYIILKSNCSIYIDDFNNDRFKFKISVPFEFDINFRVYDLAPFIRKNKIEFGLSEV